MFNAHQANRSLNILPLKQQENIQDDWLGQRLDTILFEAMEKAGIPMWIVVSKEYNEDPVVKSITPCIHDTSGRLAIYIFYLEKTSGQLERYFIGSTHPDMNTLYKFIWNRSSETQWERLRKLIEEKQPDKIAINHSNHIAVADGLTHSLHQKLIEEIGSYSDKLVSSEYIVTHWFLKRIEEEMTACPFLADLTNNLAKQAISNEVIVPGITSTDDVVHWIRQSVRDLGLNTSFYPTVDIQRQGCEVDRLSPAIILPGDIVHLDFGLEYLGLSTDTQQLAYVLKQGETNAPQGLLDAFKQALEMEDIVLKTMVAGTTGNEVFETSITMAKQKNIQAMLYSHPIGVHCHEAGPYIGLYDQQKSIPFKGDFEVVSNSAYALEFNIKAYIPEWQQETFIYLEQPIAVYNDGADYLTPRQETFYLIR